MDLSTYVLQSLLGFIRFGSLNQKWEGKEECEFPAWISNTGRHYFLYAIFCENVSLRRKRQIEERFSPSLARFMSLGTAVGALYQVEWAGCKIVVTATSESAVLSWADRGGLRLHQLQARCRANIWDCQSPHLVPSKVPKLHNEKQKSTKFGIPGNAGRVPLVTIENV